MKTATKHAKSKQHINSMKFWKKQLLMQEQQMLMNHRHLNQAKTITFPKPSCLVIL